MADEKPKGGVPPIEPAPAVAPPVPVVPPVPPVEAAPVVAPPVPPLPRVDPYTTTQPNYGPAPTAAPPAGYAPAGYANQQPAYYAPQQPQGPIGVSVASLVLGIVGVDFSFGFGIGLFPAIAGVITGHIGYSRQPRGKGFALAGLITGYVGILFSLIGVAFLIFFIIIGMNESNYGPDYSN
jgi:hypothetical protein